MKPKPSDPTMDEVREARRRISERHGHDPRKVVAYYMQLQKKYQERLVDYSAKSVPGKDQSAA